MMPLFHHEVLAVLVVGSLAAVCSAAPAPPAVPLGHRDYMPTPTRPLGWRGDGTGLFIGATCPTNWAEKAGARVLWRTPVPFGHCSPIVFGGKVFITGDNATLTGKSFHNYRITQDASHGALLCLDADNGRILWRHDCELVPSDRDIDAHNWESYWSSSYPTPVSDGSIVCAHYPGGAAVACDINGKRLWTTPLPRYTNHATSSPILFPGKFVFYQVRKSAAATQPAASQPVAKLKAFATALDTANGRLLWETPLADIPGPSNSICGSMVRMTVDGLELAITASGDILRASDGVVLVPGAVRYGGNTPVALGNRLYITQGTLSVMAYDLSRQGENGIQRTLAWRTEVKTPVRAEEETAGFGDWYPSRVYASMLVSDGKVHLVGSIGELMVLDAATGKQIDTIRRFPNDYKKFHARRSSWREYYVGPMRTANLVVLGCNSGVFAFDPAAPMKDVLCSIVPDWWSSCPFFHGDRVYLRTMKEVICIGPAK
jgi:outer membrane protein assembly factor BamB